MLDTVKLFFLLFSAVKLRPKEGETYFDVVAIVDPVTRDAQRLAPLLLVCMKCCKALDGDFKKSSQLCKFGMFVFLPDWVMTSGLLRVCLSCTIHFLAGKLITQHYMIQAHA